MRIYEITGGAPPVPAEVTKTSSNELTYKQPDPKNPGAPAPEVTVPLKPGVVTVGQDGVPVVDPKASAPSAPDPAAGLKPGQDIKVVGAPGAMTPNAPVAPTPAAPASPAPAAPKAPAPAAPAPSQPPAGTPPEQGGQQNAPTTENFGEDDPISKLEKEFKSLNEPLDEAAYITKLAQRVAGVSVLNKQTVNQDVLNLKKLAGI
jgi:hypothetical protein